MLGFDLWLLVHMSAVIAAAYWFDWDLSRVLSLSGCLVEAKMVVQFQLTVMWTCNGLLLPLFFVEVILYFVQFSCVNQIIQIRLLSFTFCILLASSHFLCKWNCVWFTWMEVFFFFPWICLRWCFNLQILVSLFLFVPLKVTRLLNLGRATMSDEGEKTCPLCAEEMDLTDQQLKPCKCGYEVCFSYLYYLLDNDKVSA